MRKPFVGAGGRSIAARAARRWRRVTTVAVTPALAALILSRMPASVFSPAPIGIVIAVAPALAVKAVWSAFQLPRRIVRVPVPTASVAAPNWPTGLTMVCVDESDEHRNRIGAGQGWWWSLAATRGRVGRGGVRQRERVGRVQRRGGVAERRDQRLHLAECRQLRLHLVAGRLQLGQRRLSTSMSGVTMLLTSRPLPMPAMKCCRSWMSVPCGSRSQGRRMPAARDLYRRFAASLRAATRPVGTRAVVGASARGRSALQQLQHLLRHLVGLRDHRRAGLLQHLGARQVGGFRREVGILDAAARGREVLAAGLQVLDRRREAVLDRAERGAAAGDRRQRGVDRRRARRWRRRAVEMSSVAIAVPVGRRRRAARLKPALAGRRAGDDDAAAVELLLSGRRCRASSPSGDAGIDDSRADGDVAAVGGRQADRVAGADRAMTPVAAETRLIAARRWSAWPATLPPSAIAPMFTPLTWNCVRRDRGRCR